MRSRILLTSLLTALFVLVSGCGGVPNSRFAAPRRTAPTGLLISLLYRNTIRPANLEDHLTPSTLARLLLILPASGHYLDYVSDRIGLAIVVTDTSHKHCGQRHSGNPNAVTDAGNGASPCDPSIPPTIDVFGNFTRFGCRNPPFHLGSGFGGNGNFGGFRAPSVAPPAPMA